MIYFEGPHYRTDEPVLVTARTRLPLQTVEVSYLTDIVFQGKKFAIGTKLVQVEPTKDLPEYPHEYRLSMDFRFATAEAEQHNQMINNVGMLHVTSQDGQLSRKMALILSKEGAELYLTFIASQGR